MLNFLVSLYCSSFLPWTTSQGSSQIFYSCNGTFSVFTPGVASCCISCNLLKNKTVVFSGPLSIFHHGLPRGHHQPYWGKFGGGRLLAFARGSCLPFLSSEGTCVQECRLPESPSSGRSLTSASPAVSKSSSRVMAVTIS